MHVILVNFLALLVIIISVFLTLIAKAELDKMFRDKKAEIPFHICNIIATVVLAYCIKFVMMVFVFKEAFHILLEYFILLGLTLPIYLFGNHVFIKYQLNNRKYETTDDGKIIILNEKYLQRKKPPGKMNRHSPRSKTPK